MNKIIHKIISLLNWIGGIFFILIGFGLMSDGVPQIGIIIILLSIMILPTSRRFLEQKLKIHKIKKFKVWTVVLIIFLMFYGIPQKSNVDFDETNTNISHKNVNQIIDPKTILPNKDDLSTEYIVGEVKNTSLNSSNFMDGASVNLRIGGFYSRNIIDISIFTFNSSESANIFYDFKKQEDYTLQKGGYSEIHIKKYNKCSAYKVDKFTVELGQAYCLWENIYVEIHVVSETFDAESYLKETALLIYHKI